MNDNLGKYLMNVADIIKGVGIFLSIASGVIMVVVGEFSHMEISFDPSVRGIVYAVGGSVFSWLLSLIFRGFGTLIESVIAIKEHVTGEADGSSGKQ